MINLTIEMPVAKTSNNGFELLVEQTITSSIRDLLGESSMHAILYHIGMEKPASDPALFHQRLLELLHAPSSIIEEIIIKDLFRNLDLLYVPRGAFDFNKYVNAAREAYAMREKKKIG